MHGKYLNVGKEKQEIVSILLRDFLRVRRKPQEKNNLKYNKGYIGTQTSTQPDT